MPTDRVTCKKKDLKLHCFSPEVMLATFAIETLLALYTLLKHRTSHLGRMVIVTLLLLATFQLAEYQICTGSPAMLWAKIGLVAITLLPPLGIHLIAIISKSSRFLTLSYLIAFGYIASFIFIPGVVQGATCGGNYVIVHLSNGNGWGAYYIAILVLGIWEAVANLRNKKLIMAKQQRTTLRYMILGYLAFMLPMAIVYVASEEARNAVPSIMCGFALLLALILAFRVVPNYEKSER